jgi:beta-galactosidase
MRKFILIVFIYGMFLFPRQGFSQATLDKITMPVGAAYYPNNLSAAQIEADALLMQKAGFKFARMGDLVWSSFEPEEGKYNFTWLHTAVNILAKHGIKTFLATPTSAIPKWMYDKHPDMMQITAAGERKPYGKRRHACLNNPNYQNYCTKIVTAMSKAFATDTNVIAVQIDNELMAEDPYCYCHYCQQKFSTWLEKKYNKIEQLNTAWNLSFWGEELQSFNQIFLPRKGDNPSAFQNYQNFCSDYNIDFFNLQKNIFKSFNANLPITHNVCSSGFLYQMDLYKLAQNCDFLSVDNYPYGWTLENEYGNKGVFDYTPHMASMALAQIRGSKQASFWVTEAQIARTAGNQRKIVEAETVKLWSLQEMAQGAAGISFFPFKTFAAAHEHVMTGVLDEDNVPRRRFYEAQQTAKELDAIKQITGSTLPYAEVAIIRDYTNDWAFEDGRFAADFRYMRELFKYYRACRNASVNVDVISSSDNFNAYKLIIVPYMVLTNETVNAKLKTAAANGATVLITCMTGLRNDDVHSFGRILHATVEELAGISIQEQHALIGAEETKLKLLNDTTNYSCGLWHDVFSLTSAKAIGFYNSRFFKQQPAITQNKFSKGTVYYVGSVLNYTATYKLIEQALSTASIQPIAISNNELVEVTTVKPNKGIFIYAINYSNTDQTITLSVPAKDISNDKVVTNTSTIKARSYKVLTTTKPMQ